ISSARAQAENARHHLRPQPSPGITRRDYSEADLGGREEHGHDSVIYFHASGPAIPGRDDFEPPELPRILGATLDSGFSDNGSNPGEASRILAFARTPGFRFPGSGAPVWHR